MASKALFADALVHTCMFSGLGSDGLTTGRFEWASPWLHRSRNSLSHCNALRYRPGCRGLEDRAVSNFMIVLSLTLLYSSCSSELNLRLRVISWRGGKSTTPFDRQREMEFTNFFSLVRSSDSIQGLITSLSNILGFENGDICRNSSKLPKSLKRFWMGVPVIAHRLVALIAQHARAIAVALFRIVWAKLLANVLIEGEKKPAFVQDNPVPKVREECIFDIT